MDKKDKIKQMIDNTGNYHNTLYKLIDTMVIMVSSALSEETMLGISDNKELIINNVIDAAKNNTINFIASSLTDEEVDTLFEIFASDLMKKYQKLFDINGLNAQKQGKEVLIVLSKQILPFISPKNTNDLEIIKLLEKSMPDLFN